MKSKIMFSEKKEVFVSITMLPNKPGNETCTW